MDGGAKAEKCLKLNMKYFTDKKKKRIKEKRKQKCSHCGLSSNIQAKMMLPVFKTVGNKDTSEREQPLISRYHSNRKYFTFTAAISLKKTWLTKEFQLNYTTCQWTITCQRLKATLKMFSLSASALIVLPLQKGQRMRLASFQIRWGRCFCLLVFQQML